MVHMSIIPTKNKAALIGYYTAVFSLIPCFGALLGPVAVILGILGLKKVKEEPEASGTAHAWIGIALGGLTALGNWGGMLAMFLGG